MHPSLVAPTDVHPGGGIVSIGEHVLAMTGSGAFYRFVRDEQTGTVSSVRLQLPLLGNQSDFRAATSESPGEFRVHDLAIRHVSDGFGIYASHHVWEAGERCVRLALATIVADAAFVPRTDWRTIWMARDCVPVIGDQRGSAFEGVESGGRLAWLDNSLLLSTGDHQFDGVNLRPALAQDLRSDYGKTLLIDPLTGGAQVYTKGHRNPQGLFVDGSSVWSTEHGPQGGDELNVLLRGADYGWPSASYGTDYGRTEWPVTQSREASAFVTPVYAWVPSIGVSNLIRIKGTRFRSWQNDFLVGSLRGRTVFRIVMDGSRVAVVEPVRIGRPIRDLVESADGRLWLWGDSGDVVELAIAEDLTAGEAAFRPCAGCHLTGDISGGRGPTLLSIVGASIASRSDYSYTPALRSVGGVWSDERFVEFLADPDRFAPGSAMRYQVTSDAERKAILEYLRALPRSYSPDWWIQ